MFATARSILTGSLGQMSERQSGSASDRTMCGVDLSGSNELDMASNYKMVAGNRKGKDVGSHLWIRHNLDDAQQLAHVIFDERAVEAYVAFNSNGTIPAKIITDVNIKLIPKHYILIKLRTLRI